MKSGPAHTDTLRQLRFVQLQKSMASKFGYVFTERYLLFFKNVVVLKMFLLPSRAINFVKNAMFQGSKPNSQSRFHSNSKTCTG